jgi:hypothetical protein
VTGPYYARPASDRDENWPIWMVCRDGLNVGFRTKYGPRFARRARCEAEAERLNKETDQ